MEDKADIPAVKPNLFSKLREYLHKPLKTTTPPATETDKPGKETLDTKAIDQFPERINELLFGSEEAVTEDDIALFGDLLTNFDNPEVNRAVNTVILRIGNALEPQELYLQPDPETNRQQKLCYQLISGSDNESRLAKIIQHEITENNSNNRDALVVGVRYLTLSHSDNRELTTVLANSPQQTFQLLEASYQNALGDDVDQKIDAYMLLNLYLNSDQTSETADKENVGYHLAEAKIAQLIRTPSYPDNNQAKYFELAVGDYGHSADVAMQLLLNVASEMQVDLAKLAKVWRHSQIERHDTSLLTMFKNIRVMQAVETAVPQGVGRLNNDWGIKSFARFSPEYWINMLADIDNKTKKWVLNLSSEYDPDGALANYSPIRGEKSLAITANELNNNGWSMRTMEVGSEQEVSKLVEQIDKAGYVKANGFIIDAHGKPGSFILGSGGDEGVINSEEIRIGKFPIFAIVEKGSPGVGTMCHGAQGVSAKITESLQSVEFDSQEGSGSWNEILPQFVDGNLAGFQTKPSTKLVEHRYDPKSKQAVVS